MIKLSEMQLRLLARTKELLTLDGDDQYICCALVTALALEYKITVKEVENYVYSKCPPNYLEGVKAVRELHDRISVLLDHHTSYCAWLVYEKGMDANDVDDYLLRDSRRTWVQYMLDTGEL